MERSKMKIKIEPERLKRCVDNAMISKSKPTIDPAVFIFEPEKVTNFGIVAGNIGTYQEYKKNFFLGYECEGKEVIPINDSISGKLKWGFDSSEMEVKTKENTIFFEVKDGDKFDTTLENYEPAKLPWAFIHHEEIGGFVPIFNFAHDPEWKKDEGKVTIESIIEVEREKLKLPQASEYEFLFDDNGLVARITEGGNFTRPIEGKILSKKSITVKVDSILFNTIVENLPPSGTIKLAITDDMLLFIVDRKDHSITYFMATQIE